ncbi:alcohol dehydrogenase catalytic domain-containing protein [Streptomyces sp. NPDC056013]|uniref:alcohol dehydrogenase catalytic domain-containing protein n=1 Tax=Streptomyces sp. NPDC056013 TaxID=3345680 RepID=UPI0035D6445D
MLSYHLSHSGAGLAGLAVREHDMPVPGPGQALVAVRATSLSFRELMVLDGTYVLPVKPDVVPVSDGAGEVVALGPGGADTVRVGDRVALPGRTARSPSSTSRSAVGHWTACSPSSRCSTRTRW